MGKHMMGLIILPAALAGSAGADDQVTDLGGATVGDTNRSIEAPRRPVAGGTRDEVGGIRIREEVDAPSHGRARPGAPLTVRQKRLFVLGIWAAEKK
jgi:hypothetical protein